MSSFCLTSFSIKHNHKTKKGCGVLFFCVYQEKVFVSPFHQYTYKLCCMETYYRSGNKTVMRLSITLHALLRITSILLQNTTSTPFFVKDFLQRHHEQKEHADIFRVTLPNYISCMGNSSSYVLEFIVSFYWWYVGITLHTLFYKDVSHHEQFFLLCEYEYTKDVTLSCVKIAFIFCLHFCIYL